MTSSHEQTTVSIIRDEELLFSDGFAYIPNLTLTIEHEALQSPVPMNVTVDGDVFTFPDESLFNDRFITWRGMGQKMFLEERSLQSSLQFSICLFFPHAPILPGTTITVLNDVLFLIVPTQISIHRFYIYLPKSVTMKDPILKCFEGNDEMCFHHEVHSIQSHGNPIKASIAQNLLATTVLLVTFEGMLTHINMPTDKTKEVEETTLKGSGMIRRLLKRASTGYSRDKDSHHALDISVLQANEQRESPLFFAIYRDLCVRVWNGEHRSLLKTIEFDKMISKINADDLNNVTVKATIAHNGEVMLMVTINTKNNTLFLLLKENGTQYEKIAYFSAPHFVSKCSLIDSDLKHLGDGYWKVMGLWNDSSSRSSYRLLHITIEEINHEREQRRNDLIHPWRAVMTASSSSIISPSETTLEEIHSILFNRDQHSLEVLTRAIQIVCRGQHNDSTTLTTWVELEKFVENYSMTSEFDEKFCNDGSLKKEDGFLMLLRKIYTKCTELERSMNSPIKIFQMSSSSCHFWGVLRHGSVTIVEETAKVLLKNLALNDFKAWSRSMDDLVKYTEMALACSSQEEDIDDEYLSPPFPRLTSLEIERLLSGAQTILQHIQKMTASKEEMATLDVNSSNSHFTSGLIVSILRRNVRRAQATAHNLSLLCLRLREKQWSSETSKQCLELYGEAHALGRSLKLLNEQLSLNIISNSSFVSLGSWINEEERLTNIFSDGLPFTSTSSSGKELNDFVANCAQGLLTAFYPTNNHCLLFKLLFIEKHYLGLKDLIKLTTLYEQEFLKSNCTESPTFEFYLGVAYAAAGLGEKALERFNSCISSGEKGDRGLSMTLSVPENRIQKELMSRLFMEIITILAEHGHKEQVTSISKKARQYLNDKNSVQNRAC